MRFKMYRKYLFLIVISIYMLTLGSLWSQPNSAKPYLKELDFFKLDNFREPSGLVYSPNRNTLFVVGDEGHIAEISLEGELLHQSWLGERDLEGIMIFPEQGMLYALDEKTNHLIKIHPDTLEILAYEQILPSGTPPYEGLGSDGRDTFFLVNQKLKKKSKDAALFMMKVGKINKIKTGIEDQSALLWTSEGFYILSDTLDRLYKLDLKGQILWHCQLPGKNQEGLAVDGDGYFYVAQDSGGILKLELHE
ncbi:hypothetical protein EXM22_02980 [Oceanispirochaeta crateris]|uniref:SMP-30/Gluconolactonase/LRE-like region domain-containing protein n=1 Tax=Oceanispirochaeta crateris TaxID=2518645 RepID=A0A5C1QI78_9SPIO|nr:SdiA-regulated domain-containing protein [Oceanispirochaeta crateris]QEN06998.1 hypothetical protein EXM22_02980 [Oceanispirochaeta crateris]